jgi:tetratricopeptide (TPR) repeat protein
MLVTLPFVLLLLDAWPLARRPSGRLILEKLPLLLLAAASAAVTVAAQAGGGAMHASESWPLGARVSNALVSYVAYLWSTILPTGLACFYPHPFALDSDGTLLRAAGAALLLAAASGGALVVWRRRPYLTVGWFWYVGTLVPVIGLIQVGAQARADRYTYLPLIGIYVAVVWAVAELIERKPKLRTPALAVAAVVLLALAVTTRTQIGYWKNGRTLFEHALRVTTGNYIAHNNLGGEFEARGEYEEAERQFRQALYLREDFPPALNNLGLILTRRGDLEGAIEDFSRALELDPRYAEAHNNLGVALQRQGRLARALTHFEAAVRLDPNHAEAHNNLGVIFEARRDPTRAEMHYERALALDPGMTEARSNLGNVLLARGDLAGAQAHYEAALVGNPDFSEAHNNLGFVLAQQGRLAEAASHYRRAIELRPDLTQAAGSLAWILATSPDPSLRSGGEALIHAERCTVATGQTDVVCLEALAAAHAELGDFEQAVRWQTLAVTRAAAGGQRAPRSRLELYRSGRPYRSADQ